MKCVLLNRIKFSCVFLFLVGGMISYGQTTVLDSLEKELQLHPKEDTIRINLLTQLAHSATDINLAKAEKACDEARRISIKLNYEMGLAHVFYEEAWISMGKSEYKDAISNAQKALNLYKKKSSLEGESLSLNCIGSAYYYQSNYSKAMDYIQQSAEIDEKRKDFKGMSGCYVNIGNILADQGKFEESLAYYFKALELKKKVKDDFGLAKCLGNIGSIYGEQGNYPKALSYFKRAQAMHEKLGNTSNASICLMNIGATYLHQDKLDDAMVSFNQVIDRNKGNENTRIQAIAYSELGSLWQKKKDFPKALDYFSRAITISRQANNLREVGSNLNNIGSILIAQKKYQEALKHFKEAKEINEANELKMGTCSSLIGMSKIYLKQKMYAKALNLGLEAQSIANELSLLPHQRDAAEVLAEVYAQLGQRQKALKNHQQFKSFSDSIFNKEKIEKIAQIEYDFKFQKELEVFNAKEKKLTKKVERTSQDLEKSETRFLIGVVIFLVVLLIAVLIIFQLRLRHIKSQNENVLLEQKLLRSQMTPHFIFNSMSVLQGMILNKEDAKANQYLSKFSRLLRITLESSREKMTSLSQELLALEHYVALQHLESDKPIDYLVNVDDSIQLDEVLIPPMLIQPFIENAIEHGFTHESIDKKIEVALQFNEQQLECIIKDNGVGLEATKRQSSNQKKSLATSITKERITLLSKELKNGGKVEIEDRRKWNEHGTIVTLIIPYKFGQFIKTN